MGIERGIGLASIHQFVRRDRLSTLKLCTTSSTRLNDAGMDPKDPEDVQSVRVSSPRSKTRAFEGSARFCKEVCEER